MAKRKRKTEVQERLFDETNGDRDTAAHADVESDLGDAAHDAQKVEAFTSPVRVTFHHIRGRLADVDGLSGKAVLDGIVEAGILATDSPEQVAEVAHTQRKGKIEKTIVVIEEIETTGDGKDE